MAWVAVAGAVVGAGVSAYGAHKQGKAAEEAAKRASGPSTYDRTTESNPWGPSVGAREGILARVNELLAGQSGGGTAAATGGGMSRRERRRERRGGGGGGGGGGSTKVDYQGYIKEYLDGKHMEANPHLDAILGTIERDLQENYDRQYAQADLAAESGGRLGGSTLGYERGVALGEMQDAYADQAGALRFQDYRANKEDMLAALGIGTGYDAQLRQIAAQRAAARASNAVARGHLSLARSMLPYQQLGALTDIVGGVSDRYGTVHEYGTSQGPPVAPEQTPNPWLSAAQGGLAGWQFGNQLSNQYGWGKGSQRPSQQPGPAYLPGAPELNRSNNYGV